ncbi:YbaN family protein [Algicola sagamiensis]|uniref:YbaN family protein n=1 Tax=Algicola sagamiensis TaxID=163869 RepID=UPI000370F151|nr:YbaN family protein [Algicola sagamiensis]
MGRVFYFISGWISLGLGFIGIFLPLLPTTPFVLLAAVCFSRSSERVHEWLLAHRLFGPIIIDWQRYGVIKRKTKMLSTSTMVLFISYPMIWGTFSIYIKLVIIMIMVGVTWFIWTRPSERPT